MNDDFAPRPNNRLPERIVGAFAIVAFVAMTFCARSLWIERDDALDALADANLTITKHEQMIDQQARIIQAWVDEHPPTDGVEDGKMGASKRILPQVRDLTREANEAVIEVREFVRDVKEGRLGAHVEGSIMRGTADITLKRVP